MKKAPSYKGSNAMIPGVIIISALLMVISMTLPLPAQAGTETLSKAPADKVLNLPGVIEASSGSGSGPIIANLPQHKATSSAEAKDEQATQQGGDINVNRIVHFGGAEVKHNSDVEMSSPSVTITGDNPSLVASRVEEFRDRYQQDSSSGVKRSNSLLGNGLIMSLKMPL